METKEKTPLNLLFVFGYEKYFIDKIKQNKEADSDKLNLLSSLLEDKKNYVFIINYVFEDEEYNSHPNKDKLPPCIKSNDSTHIPQELIFRAKNLGHLSIFHRKSLSLLYNINPYLDESINNLIIQVKDTEFELNKELSKIMIFNLNEDKNDDSVFILTDLLTQKDGLKDIKIEIY